jgi:hypothetical protein
MWWFCGQLVVKSVANVVSGQSFLRGEKIGTFQDLFFGLNSQEFA